ncbi:head-tail connector protein [Mesorhizobium retamae]|uniref:Phage gp6-like head-tail connector protein n=1 Tax=Mesorhizobium retamae TaxID=2912854 RepID=A0ABS9QNI3_9HYPH|nr:head-tail connector protein [Mesorhizobium sp. IRAMC:0171]MCG7508875.1 phage gp6-like head-tail connector protein [Mesorhizobium sp. IRAMC:0171]
MVPLVTLEFVKKAIRVAEYNADGEMLPNTDDDLVEGCIEAATEAVLRYLRVLDADPPIWTETTAPKAVKQAIVLGVNSLYNPDQGELLSGLGSSDPKNPMVGLLCMLRKPTLA